MKKRLLLLVLLLSSVMYVKEVPAQILPEFGILGGINFASFSDSKQEVDSRRVGLLSGVYGTFKIPFIPFLFNLKFYTLKKAPKLMKRAAFALR